MTLSAEAVAVLLDRVRSSGGSSLEELWTTSSNTAQLSRAFVEAFEGESEGPLALERLPRRHLVKLLRACIPHESSLLLPATSTKQLCKKLTAHAELLAKDDELLLREGRAPPLLFVWCCL